MRRSLGVLVAGAAGAAAVVAPVAAGLAPAGAAVQVGGPAGSSPFIPAPPPPGVPGATSPDKTYSSNWSGYAVQAAKAFTKVAGDWNEPGVTCGASLTYSAFWVGLDGYATTTVEQTGTAAYCTRGSAHYYAWYEMYPAASVVLSGVVKPGDALSAQVSHVGTAYTLTISDATEGWKHTIKKTSTDANGSAEWIAEAPSTSTGPLPLANYGTVSFTGAVAATGGVTKPVKAFRADSGPHHITMTQSSKVVSQPSALSTAGTAFTISYK